MHLFSSWTAIFVSENFFLIVSFVINKNILNVARRLERSECRAILFRRIKKTLELRTCLLLEPLNCGHEGPVRGEASLSESLLELPSLLLSVKMPQLEIHYFSNLDLCSSGLTTYSKSEYLTQYWWIRAGQSWCEPDFCHLQPKTKPDTLATVHCSSGIILSLLFWHCQSSYHLYWCHIIMDTSRWAITITFW